MRWRGERGQTGGLEPAHDRHRSPNLIVNSRRGRESWLKPSVASKSMFPRGMYYVDSPPGSLHSISTRCPQLLKGRDLEGFLRLSQRRARRPGPAWKRQQDGVARRPSRNCSTHPPIARLPSLLAHATRTHDRPVAGGSWPGCSPVMGNSKLSSQTPEGRLFWHGDLSTDGPIFNTPLCRPDSAILSTAQVQPQPAAAQG